MSSASDGRDGSCLQRRLYVELSISLKPTLCEALPALCVSKSKIRRSDLLGSSAARSWHCSTISRCLMSTVICMYAASVDSVKWILICQCYQWMCKHHTPCWKWAVFHIASWMLWLCPGRVAASVGRYATVISPSLSFHCVSWWMLWTVIQQ